MSLLLHLFALSLLISVSGAKFSGRPGINYGQLGNNLPSPSDSVNLIKSLNAKRVKLYDANPKILAALNGTDITVSVMVPNELLVNISKSASLSDDWIRSNILPFYPTTKIRYLLVGNEILSLPDSELKSSLVPAMRKIQRSLKSLGVKKVKVGTTLATDVLQSSFPPSSGEFREDISGLIMKPMLQFLNRTKSFLFVDVYPYFAWAQDPTHVDLDYAIFESTNVTVTDPVSNLTYHNLFDQMIDAFVFAMKRVGYPDIRIWVAETGWPNNGDYDQIGANIYNAATYNRNVVKKLAADPPVGTPARPGKVLPAFVFALYNENQKTGPGTERHFGLLHPNGTQVYGIDLSGKTEYKESLPAPENNDLYKGKIWCVVAKGANWTQLGDALSYACSQGNNTCDPIQRGGPCQKPDLTVLHASYAFSSYWAQFRRTLLQRKLASTDGNVGYCTTTVCQGFQHSVHQRSSSVVFNGEWELRSESNKVRMVPKIIKVGNQTEVAETHQVPGTVSAWREEANKLRERNGQIARNLDDNGYFNGSVPIISSAPSYETSQKIDYEFKPRGTTRSTTATLNKELIGITQSEPVVSLPRKGLDVGDNMDVNPKGEGIQRPLISDKSSGTANGNKNTVAISKVERSTEPSNVRENLGKIYDKVLIVDNVQAAKDTVAKLVNQFRNHVHSCDTEVSGIEVKEETPVDHGELICFSIYCGPEADFGNGKSCIWVDVLGENGREVLAEFKPYFEDSFIRKVWHNYSFDSHIIRNHGIEISGFHADTMHMARLWDSARRIKGGYSLEALTSDPKVLGGTQTKEEAEFLGKISMKTIFGKRKLKKDGSEGKIVVIPPVEELQREDREAWISYSALDAISTLKLYESMTKKLQLMDWHLDGKPVLGRTMLDFYHEFWRPFGELLVKMEAEGILVDREYLAEIEKVAKAEQQVAGSRFRNWASKYCPDAKYMNIGSDTQLRQLFFGGISNSSHDEVLPVEKLFKVPNIDKVIEEGKKTPTKFRNIKLHRISDSPLSTENFTASGWPSVGGDVLKELAGKVSAEYDFMDDVSDISLEEVVEDDDVETSETQKSKTDDETDTSAYGTAYVAFGGGERGKEACHAIASLCEVCSIDSLISNFILPLQGSNVSGKDGRVHCSLNINTETGRLSARRPNLQNQPALEKDRYKIRKAFVASPGNTLVVADYGQLELRILAHLTGCKSMMEAFKAGGDFHSRTAMNMYPHVREAVENGQVILEWHPEPGEDKPPVPLLKDAFGSERRKAKMLNFSIAYGKTAVGLSRDWKVSTKEAQETVDLWYNDRQEVRKWQEMRKKEAIEDGYVLTLLGRSRRFPASKSRAQRNHIQRAAINTPVQGSAADVAMCAMLEISINQQLKKLGWRLLLQIHDEVILEGPIESAEIAKDIVVDCMSKPFNGRNILSVDLSVDAKCAQNWYAAK